MANSEIIVNLNRDIVVAHRSLAAKKTELQAAAEEAAALTDAGGTDEDIDAAERRATLANRACIRFERDIDTLIVRRAEAVTRERAGHVHRLNTQAARELAEINKDHRALLAKIVGHVKTRNEYAKHGLNAEVSAVPQLCIMLFDQNAVLGPNGTVSACHPALDYVENEVDRFRRALKTGAAS
jgi:hypothetical protein